MDIVNFGEVRAAAPPRAAPPPPLSPAYPPLSAVPPRAPHPPPSQEAENASVLEALLNAVNSDDNSHLVTVPPGPHVSPISPSSPIVQSEDGGGGGGGGAAGGGGGGGGGEFQEFAGVDPTLDPEFAWRCARRWRRSALDRRRKESAPRRRRWRGLRDGRVGAGGAADAPMGEAAAADEGELDEAALLEQAIAMSMPPPPPPTSSPPPRRRRRDAGRPAGGHAPAPAKNAAPPAARPAPAPADVTMGDAADDDEDAEMQLALAM